MFRKALVAEAAHEAEGVVVRCLHDALEKAERAQNGAVMLGAAHRLGFQYAS